MMAKAVTGDERLGGSFCFVQAEPLGPDGSGW